MGKVKLKPHLFSQLTHVKTTTDFEIYSFIPSLLKAFPFEMEKISIAYRIRCILEYFVGYMVFYIKCQDEWAGYCIVSNGRNFRYHFCTADDITFGRYFISPVFRGKSLGVKMLKEVLDNMSLEYSKAYAYVHRGNKASHATVLKIGCVPIDHFDKVGKLRRIVPNQDGKYTLYCYEKQDTQPEGLSK